MFNLTLLETRRPLASGGSMGTGSVSFVAHAALIAGVLYASLHPKHVEDVGRLIVDVAISQAPAPRPPDLPTIAPPPVGFSTLQIPTTVLSFIPPPSRTPFDAASFSGFGVDPVTAWGRDTVARPVVSAEAVYAAEVVEERPERIGGAAPAYPELLRSAGITGRVRLELVVDTAGRVQPGSARVLETTHELFSQAVLAAAGSWVFRPGRTDGRAVKVRIRMPVDFVKLPG